MLRQSAAIDYVAQPLKTARAGLTGAAFLLQSVFAPMAVAQESAPLSNGDAGVAIAGLSGVYAPAGAARVDLCLVVALDMSGSIDPVEWTLQTEGLARAFEHPAVIGAIQSRGSIAVLDVTYGGNVNVAGAQWHVLSSAGDAARLSAYFRGLTYDRPYDGGGTTLLHALSDSIDHAASCPNPTADRVVDIQGDGEDDLYIARPNRGAMESPDATRSEHNKMAQELRERAMILGVAVNGLPIMTQGEELADYYQDHIAPDGRIFPAIGFADFERAIILKLVAEIAALPTDATPSMPIHAAPVTRRLG